MKYSLVFDWIVFLVATNVFSFGFGLIIGVSQFDLTAILAVLGWLIAVPVVLGVIFVGYGVYRLSSRTLVVERALPKQDTQAS